MCSKITTINFLGVQPIDLDTTLYTSLLSKKTSFQNKNDKKLYSMDWLDNYTNIYDVYEILDELSMQKILDNSLIDDLKKKEFIPYNKDKINFELSLYLNQEKTKYALYFDPRFFYFVLVYDLCFDIPNNLLENCIKYDGTKNNKLNNDLYNTVRKLIVRENDHSQLSSWGEEIQAITRQKIYNFIKENYKIEAELSQVSIPNNSCNISVFIDASELDNVEKLANNFIELNQYAERNTTSLELRKLYNDTVFYSFNGRFHTIVFTKKQDQYRFYPLQFHIQYMWFLVERYNKLMNKINLDLMQDDSVKILNKYSKIINAMINKIELLNLHDKNFKHSIEADYQNIYKANERQWAIEELLESSKQYINFFKDYLDRLFQQKNELYQKRQNLILLAISILQLVALISVWTDYLALLDQNNLNLDSRFLNLFGNLDTLITFNLYTPVYFLFIIMTISYYLWQKRIR